MKGKRLTGYSGKLNPEQIADGINKANENANRLAEDARLLYDGGRFPSAASLAILAIEESGKVSVLRSLALARDDEEVKQTWKDFRKHTAKNAGWIFAELVAGGARQLEDFRAMYLDDAEHPFILDKIKQLGFYTDCYGKGRWSAPIDALDRQITERLVRIAELQSRRKLVTATEIQLWAKHVGPVWKTDTHSMKLALLDWHTEMKRVGLADEDDTESWQEFLFGTNEASASSTETE